jgi:hypothetical protein
MLTKINEEDTSIVEYKPEDDPDFRYFKNLLGTPCERLIKGMIDVMQLIDNPPSHLEIDDAETLKNERSDARVSDLFWIHYGIGN